MNLSQAQAADIPVIEQLLGEGVFRDIKPEELPKDGDIIIACADGDRIFDTLFHHRGLCEGGRPCHHLLSLNSGPLLLPVDSPTARYAEGVILLEHALGGRKLKGVNTVHLYGHWPCGAAGLANLSLVECLTLLGSAKERLLDFFRSFDDPPKVIPLFHVHFVHSGEQMRSYYFDRHHFAKVMKVPAGRNWRSSRIAA
jgi:hypothetical protein